MTTGLILILAILFIGGGIATLGDRIGTRVGKARLSLFNLRPKNTAVLVTIFTGSIISASTLAILFAADEGLRTGVFELEKIEGDLHAKRQELESQRQQLETTSSQKSRVERELAEAKLQQQAQKIEAQKQQVAAQQRLAAINQLLKVAIARQSATQAQLNQTTIQKAQTQGQLAVTQNQLSQVSGQFEQAKGLLTNVSQQAKTLREEIKQRQIEKQKLIDQAKGLLAERDRELSKRAAAIKQRDFELSNRAEAIKQRDLDIAARDSVIAQREARLNKLEEQRKVLEEQVANLGQSYQDLRLGKLALSRGQVLAAQTIRIQPKTTAKAVVIQLLQQANKNASDALTQLGSKPINEQVLQISDDQVDQLVKQIDDGKEYILRILSARNYVKGEKKVQVFTDVARNQLLFRTGDIIATINADSRTMTASQLQEKLDTLLFASQFRARRAGIIEDRIQIGDGLEPYLVFVDKLKQYGQPVEIKAIVAEDIYTLGPLKVHLVAIQNGQIVFGT